MSITFSIVTPTYNSEKYLRETIQSIISQSGDFYIDYIVVDNLSDDSTADIVRQYIEDIENGIIHVDCKGLDIQLVEKKDNGMYQAIASGFSVAKGNIYCWLNSDDIYMPGALDLISRVFAKYKEVKWLKGITSYIDAQSHCIEKGKLNLYSQEWIARGLYGTALGFIQQDSVFWRKEIWEDVNTEHFSSYRLAGDFFLWRSFAQSHTLFCLNAELSAFRRVQGQLSSNLQAYRSEINDFDSIMKHSAAVQKFFRYRHRLPALFRKWLFLVLFGRKPVFLIQLDNDRTPLLIKSSLYRMVECL